LDFGLGSISVQKYASIASPRPPRATSKILGMNGVRSVPLSSLFTKKPSQLILHRLMAPEPDKKKFRASLRLSLLLSTSIVKQHDLATPNYMSLAIL